MTQIIGAREWQPGNSHFQNKMSAVGASMFLSVQVSLNRMLSAIRSHKVMVKATVSARYSIAVSGGVMTSQSTAGISSMPSISSNAVCERNRCQQGKLVFVLWVLTAVSHNKE